MKTTIIAGILFVFIVAAAGLFLYNESHKTSETLPTGEKAATNNEEENQQSMTQQNGNNPALPTMIIDENTLYSAEVVTTLGSFTIELNKGETPKTVNNFIYLAGKGFYNNTIFHRVIKGFMIQGGDPTGTGSGGPGYRFEDEPFTGSYTKGTVAMANAGPNTNGSQFFIVHKDVALPPSYTIFGHVTSGMEVIDKIADQEVEQSATGENSKPVNPVKILSVKITPDVISK